MAWLAVIEHEGGGRAAQCSSTSNLELRSTEVLRYHDGADRHYLALCGCFAAVATSSQSSPRNHSMCNVSPLTNTVGLRYTLLLWGDHIPIYEPA